MAVAADKDDVDYPGVLYPAVGTRVVLPMRGRGCKRGPSEFILGAKVLQHNYRNFYDNVKIKAGGHNYEPDMVMVDADHGIFIEIEVDEPYTWSTKSPTHCKGGRDKLRNKHIT